MNFKSGWSSFKQVKNRFGYGAVCKHLLHRLINRVCYFDRLEVTALTRGQDRRPVPSASTSATTRLAAREDLLTLQAAGHWDINETKLGYFDAGDLCVLSLVDGQIAGYAWVHAKGRPELLPHLQLEVPASYLYSYATFTSPHFRGMGLQSERHQFVLAEPPWLGRQGLLAYVSHVNFASKKAQTRSGFKPVGSIWLLGSRQHFIVLTSPSLRRFGITRMKSALPPDACAQLS